MTAPPIHLAEITVFDPSIGATRVLYFATEGVTTRPSEIPASQYYDGKISQAATMRRDAFDVGTTSGRSRVGIGDLALENGDGALDVLLTYAFDGWPIKIRWGARGAAYPAGFPVKLQATMEQPVFGPSTVTIKLRSRDVELDVPLQSTMYLGDNALPDGLEGTASDHKGKPKPVCLGAVTNISPPCVNTTKLIYQVNDGPVASIDAVYDRGISLATSVAELNVQTSGFGATTIRGVTYGAGLYVAVGDSAKLFTSPDGVTWTHVTLLVAGTPNITAITSSFDSAPAGEGRFLAVGDGGLTLESFDGVSWAAILLDSPTFRGFNAVTCAAGKFMLAGDTGLLVGAASAGPGLLLGHIGASSGFGATNINGVAIGKGLVVIVGDGGKAATSTDDGVTFTQDTSGLTAAVDLTAITFGKDRFLVGNANGEVSTSLDGRTYSTRATGIAPATPIRAVAYGNGSYVYVGDGGEVGDSHDTLTWNFRDSGGSTALYAVTFGNDLFVIAGASGLLLTSGVVRIYASLADLLDDTQAPTPGTFGTYLPLGYFRIGSSPQGGITADVTQGAAAGDRTAAALYETLLLRAGMTAPEYSSADLTTLDAANSAVLGFYDDSGMTVAVAIDLVAGSVGAFWGPDRAGVFRIQQLTPPDGAPVLTFTANDLIGPLQRLQTNDQARGLPSWSTIVRWGRNYTEQTDVAPGVADDRRAIVASAWRSARAYDDAVHAAHLLAPETTEDSLLTAEADAQAEAIRRQDMRGVQADRFQVVVPLNDETVELEMGDVIEIVHDRYGLNVIGSDDGQLFRVLTLQDDAKEQRLTLNVWGESQALANLMTDDGFLEVTDDGFYLVTS